MAETITPVVHGGRRRRWAGEVALHVSGATLAAAAFGALLGGAGRLLGAQWGGGGLILVTGLAVLYLTREAFDLSVPVPQARRQVPEGWRTFFSRPVFAFLYGAGLGVGFLTYLTHGTLVAVAAVSATTASPLLGAAVMAPFGFARGLSVVVASKVRTPDDGAILLDRLAAWARSPLVRLGNAAVLAALAVAAGASLAHRGPEDWGRLAPAALAVVFTWAALAKTIRPRRWRADLERYGLPPRLSSWVVPTVPAAEACLALALLMGFNRIGGIGALVMLALFTLALLRARSVVGDRVPCGCFGRGPTVSVRAAVARNAALAAVAVVAMARGSSAGLALPPVPGGRDALPLLLAVGGLVAAAFTGWTVRRLLRGTP